MSRGTENSFVFAAFGLRSLEGWTERRAFARSVSFEYRFDEGYDAPRGWLACKLGAPSGGGLIA
ncbi:hypothetical protein ASF31_08120 [Brevundimonas sp. Leaf280]|nr:hypothetical protein ASF31_08120 [Brevundimonas sp. Leaf280]